MLHFKILGYRWNRSFHSLLVILCVGLVACISPLPTKGPWIEARSEHFTAISGLNADKVARAIKLSADKYCSASAMLASTAKITHDFEVIDNA